MFLQEAVHRRLNTLFLFGVFLGCFKDVCCQTCCSESSYIMGPTQHGCFECTHGMRREIRPEFLHPCQCTCVLPLDGADCRGLAEGWRSYENRPASNTEDTMWSRLHTIGLLVSMDKKEEMQWYEDTIRSVTRLRLVHKKQAIYGSCWLTDKFRFRTFLF